MAESITINGRATPSELLLKVAESLIEIGVAPGDVIIALNEATVSVIAGFSKNREDFAKGVDALIADTTKAVPVIQAEIWGSLN
jgi:hypothetical protein